MDVWRNHVGITVVRVRLQRRGTYFLGGGMYGYVETACVNQLVDIVMFGGGYLGCCSSIWGNREISNIQGFSWNFWLCQSDSRGLVDWGFLNLMMGLVIGVGRWWEIHISQSALPSVVTEYIVLWFLQLYQIGL